MTGCRRAAPSILPLSPARRTPHAIAAFHTSQHHRHHQPIPLSLAERQPQSSPTDYLSASLPCLPQSPAPLPPSRILDREDGEGRGAKDTAGVHPRRLRRPHLGPRCRSRYVIPLGSLALRTPVLHGSNACAHTLLLRAQPSPAGRDAVHRGPEPQQPWPRWPLAAPAAGRAPASPLP